MIIWLVEIIIWVLDLVCCILVVVHVPSRDVYGVHDTRRDVSTSLHNSIYVLDEFYITICKFHHPSTRSYALGFPHPMHKGDYQSRRVLLPTELTKLLTCFASRPLNCWHINYKGIMRICQPPSEKFWNPDILDKVPSLCYARYTHNTLRPLWYSINIEYIQILYRLTKTNKTHFYI